MTVFAATVWNVFVPAVKTLAAFSLARFEVSLRFVDASGTPFTSKPLRAFHTGAVCVVPVKTLDPFKRTRFEESERFKDDICTPLTSKYEVALKIGAVTVPVNTQPARGQFGPE